MLGYTISIRDLAWLILMKETISQAHRDDTLMDEPEGHRYIKISITLAEAMSQRLEEIIEDAAPIST